MNYQPKTGARCSCKRGVQRDNCPACEGTGWAIDFAAIRAQREQPSTLYDDALSARLPIDFHESDLYLKDSPEARALLKKHGHDTARRFKSTGDQSIWWDVPFAYSPFWRKRVTK